MPERQHHTLTLSVTDADTDELGHVNNTVYLAWMERVARAHADRVGLSLPVLQDLGAVPVARQHLINYHRPALPGDAVNVTTRIVRAEGLRATREYEIRREDGTLLVDATTEWVWVDPQRMRPRTPPAQVFTAFGFPAPPQRNPGASVNS